MEVLHWIALAALKWQRSVITMSEMSVLCVHKLKCCKLVPRSNKWHRWWQWHLKNQIVWEF